MEPESIVKTRRLAQTLPEEPVLSTGYIQQDVVYSVARDDVGIVSIERRVCCRAYLIVAGT
jgi:hypothetical protein